MLERNIVELSGRRSTRSARPSGETINLAVPGRDGVEHIAQVDSRHFLGAGQWLGRSVGYDGIPPTARCSRRSAARRRGRCRGGRG